MKYDVWTNSDMTKDKVTGRGIGEAIGDTLGKTLEGLASWIGLDGLLQQWNRNTHTSTARKISDLRSKITKLISQGELDLDRLNQKIEQLNLSGYNLTGRAAQVAGEYRQKLEQQRDETKRKNQSNLIEYEKMQQDLEKADSGLSSLSATDNRMAQEIASNVEKIIGGKQ